MEERTVPPKSEKKLALNKETIRILTEKEMQSIEGGGGGHHYTQAPCTGPSSPPATCPP